MLNKFTNNIWEHGYDDYFYNARIRGYLSSFADGNFAVNLVPEVDFNMGYASLMLYPTTTHYLTVLLAMIIPASNNIEIACDIAFFINIFLSGVAIFYLFI